MSSRTQRSPAPAAAPNSHPLSGVYHGTMDSTRRPAIKRPATTAEVSSIDAALRLALAFLAHPAGRVAATNRLCPLPLQAPRNMLYDGARYVPTETPAQQAIHAEIGNILAEAQWVVVMDEEWCARYAGERDGGADETTNSTRGYDAVIARTVYCNPWYVSRHVAATRDRAGEAQAGDNSSNTDYNYALFLHALSLAHTLLINLRYELWYRLLHIVSIPPGPLHPLADSRGGRDGEGWEFGLFAGLVRGMWDQIPTEPRIPTSPEEATEIDPICSWRERDWGNEDTDGVDTERNFDAIVLRYRRQHHKIDDSWLADLVDKFESGGFDKVSIPPQPGTKRSAPGHLARLGGNDGDRGCVITFPLIRFLTPRSTPM